MSERDDQNVRDALAFAAALSDLESQRDVLYSMTVNPRRNARRALACLDEGDMDEARHFLREAKAELEDLAKEYARWTA